MICSGSVLTVSGVSSIADHVPTIGDLRFAHAEVQLSLQIYNDHIHSNFESLNHQAMYVTVCRKLEAGI